MLDSCLSLDIHWQTDLTVLSLRGEGSKIAAAVESCLGVPYPLISNTTQAKDGTRLIWVSPNDCFVIAPPAQAPKVESDLREALQGQHFAVTDVSNGYHLLTLGGSGARSLLAQGCPLDLHPRKMGLGQCAGSHFFKASLWLWLTADNPKFQLLVRRSFAPYVNTMIQKASLEMHVTHSGAKIEDQNSTLPL